MAHAPPVMSVIGGLARALRRASLRMVLLCRVAPGDPHEAGRRFAEACPERSENGAAGKAISAARCQSTIAATRTCSSWVVSRPGVLSKARPAGFGRRGALPLRRERPKAPAVFFIMYSCVAAEAASVIF